MGFLTGKRLSSPFSKAARHELAECGDRGLPARASQWQAGSGEAGGGILLRGYLSQGHRSILTPQTKLNYTTSTAGGFCKY
jgi:hypothetical protein